MGTETAGREGGGLPSPSCGEGSGVGAASPARRGGVRIACPYGSTAKRRRPVGFRVLASKVRISVVPAMSSVTARRSPAVPVATMRAPLGSIAVRSGPEAVLPSPRKRR